jgi:hypothetical protein
VLIRYRSIAIFVPRGVRSGQDETRSTSMYDEIAEFLYACDALDEGPWIDPGPTRARPDRLRRIRSASMGEVDRDQRENSNGW